MGKVVELKKHKRFQLREVQELLPIVKKVTQKTVEQVTQLEQRIHDLDPEPSQRPYFEEQLSRIIQRWSDKISKLGALPKGFWLVDFDNGEGYYCWKYGEDEVEYCHDYESGFSSRTPIL